MGGIGVGSGGIVEGLGLAVGVTATVWQAADATPNTIKRQDRIRFGWVTELSTGAS
ncbi:MAG: hypothetical protein ACC700_11125 [Anaerolineales bacterium]